MDLKLTRENFTVQKQLLDTVNEQSLELDYVLPDYCPEIFKVLSCRIYPSVAKRSLTGSKLGYELTALIRVVYASESGEISAVEQTLSFDRSADLGASVRQPVVYIDPTVSAKSSRVVNKRRVDIRGVISVRVRASCDEPRQAVSQAKGGGIQLRRSPVTYPSKKIFITKRVTVIDEVEIIETKPPVGVVLRADASVTSAEKKILSGKLLTKGEAAVNVIYIPEGGGEIERISFDLPFSQVSDVEGLDERFDVYVDAGVASCNIRPAQKSEPAKLECELGIDISCLALKFESASLADDVFSTEYAAEAERTECEIECVPTQINETHRTRTTLTYSEGEIKNVMFACAEAGSLGVVAKNAAGECSVSGRLVVTVFAKNESGKPICLDADAAFEHPLESPVCGCPSSDIRVTVGSVTYNLTSSNAIEVTVDLRLRGYLSESKPMSFISDIALDESRPVERDRDCSLKLYYAETGEKPWEIAKRCRASLSAIIEENDIDGEAVETGCMLLIPIE